MTANQLIAMGFPLLTLATVAVVMLFVAKPWSKAVPATTRRSQPDRGGPAHVGGVDGRDAEIRTTLREAEALIRKAERQLSKADTP